MDKYTQHMCIYNIYINHAGSTIFSIFLNSYWRSGMTISSSWHIWHQSEIETLAMPSKKIVITCSQEPTSPPTIFSVRFHRGPPHCLLAEQKQRQKKKLHPATGESSMESGNFVVAWKLGGVKEWRNTCLNSSWLGINLPSMDCMCNT